MRWNNWKIYYRKIKKEFSSESVDIRFFRDKESALVLNKLLDEHESILKSHQIVSDILDEEVAIFGAGPSLGRDLEELDWLKNKTIVVADGASQAFLDLDIDIIPDYIVTDLDGDIDALKDLNEEGSNLIIHSHGNNIGRLKEFVPFFESVLGTAQVKPFGHLRNFGGFTDGDRAAFFVEEFGAQSLVLGGMDFDKKVGKYSDPDLDEKKDPKRMKRLKLEIASDMIEMLNRKGTSNIEYH